MKSNLFQINQTIRLFTTLSNDELEDMTEKKNDKDAKFMPKSIVIAGLGVH